MLKRVAYCCAILACMAALAAGAQARTTIAFGYLSNTSDNENFNYLETIFPNSFATAIKSIFDVEVRKPGELDERLKKYNLELRKKYELFELPEITDRMDAHIFIFGSFKPLPNNQISIELSLYARESNEVFTFTNIGRMETEIFRLVDRISLIVINFLDSENLYKSRPIAKGSRIALITNLEGEELNRLYAALMEGGYPLSCAQADDLVSAFNPASFAVFKYVRTKNSSYDIVTDWRKTNFPLGPWLSRKDEERAAYFKKLYADMDLNYTATKNETLDRMAKAFRNSIDVVLIVGFSENRKSCWLRAVDMKDRELVWMQSNMKTDALFVDPVENLGARIVKGLEREIKNPFEK
ncbi:MAG: hypothetical protein EPN93_20780 [Spirochaetes bacterium]|nr:MAG: hypothetical protein EPN93_20780 [Spirochaetota bacterium]